MEIKHKWQQTNFTCGAAAVAMILGITEEKARELAETSKRGTTLHGAAKALATSGFPVHRISFLEGLPLSTIGWALEVQSQRWPLYLALNFPAKRQDTIGRIRAYDRRHAVVLHRGQLFDPGEFETLTIDSIGHLADKEISINGYLILETP